MSTAQTEREEGKGEGRGGVSELCLYIGRGEEEEREDFLPLLLLFPLYYATKNRRAF